MVFLLAVTMSRDAKPCSLAITTWQTNLFGLTFIKSVSLLSSGMPDIQWMNLDPVKLMEELSQFTSLEGFKEMLDKAQVGGTNTHSQI